MTDDTEQPEGQEPEREAPVALGTYHTDARLTAQEAANKREAHAESQESGEGDE